MVISHPLEHVYYNVLAGANLNVVKPNFELDYWGLSYRQGLAYILQHDPAQVITFYAPDRIGDLNSLIFPEEEKNRLVFVDDPSKANYFVGNYKAHPAVYVYPASQDVFDVVIDGAKILSVYHLKWRTDLKIEYSPGLSTRWS